MTKNLRKILPVFLLLFATTALFAQTAEEKARIKRQRLRMIDLFHIGVGLDAHFNRNLFFSPKVSFGIGSFRNIINADVGVKYMVGGSVNDNNDESIMVHQIPIFASVQCNLTSWKDNSLFVGAEIAYHIPLNELGQSHFSGRIKSGLRLGRWDAYLFYEYDLAPMMNQKYVYESPYYNYDALHDTLFERMRYGISISYFFIL